MQDIDFDEIDRAVSSVSDSLTAEKSGETPQTPETSQVEPEVSMPVPTPTPTTPRPTSGRFMDVVHPSSDMRPSTPIRSSAPSAPSLHREEVAMHDEISKRPEPAAAASAAFHWPDPVESDLPVPEPIPEPIVEASAPAVVAEELVKEPLSSLESPFLADTKVEKRPLGAFSDTDLPLIEDPIPGTYVFGDTPQTKPEEPAHEEHEETPHELHPDLLLLEGHGNGDPTIEVAPTPEVAEDSTPLATVAPEPTVVSTGPTSISQQYVEQPSTANEPSGPIFDTEAYHQPLVHPPKKRSKALIIVWVAVLILIGGGIGAAIYFVVLPMLG